MTMRTEKTDFDKTFAEFFAGIGLMRMGLERSGWIHSFANDIDPDKEEMYRNHFRDTNGNFAPGDVHRLDCQAVPDVTLATASFPCNDLSLAGSRTGLAGKQSSAYWGFLKVIDKMGIRRPPLVLLENVPGFLSSHGGKDFSEALQALNRLGYIVDAFMIDAARFVPQSRVRLFVVGSPRGPFNGFTTAETPLFYESELRPRALAEYIFGHPEILWKIRPLPHLPSRKMALKDVIEDLPETSDFWWSSERTDYLIKQMSSKHRSQLYEMRETRKWSKGTVFRRVRNGKSMAELRIDGIAGCLRTPRGGSGRQILVIAGYGKVKVRLLTPRECARLMGADDFKITAPLNKALFGFGDAVCVPVIDWIAVNYLNPLLKEMRGAQCETACELKESPRRYAIAR
jgi:DNA (cytosine-5)-methyltransferase 1